MLKNSLYMVWASFRNECFHSRPNSTTAQGVPPVKKARTEPQSNVNRNLVTLGGADVNSVGPSSSSTSISITRPTGKTVKKTVISSKMLIPVCGGPRGRVVKVADFSALDHSIISPMWVRASLGARVTCGTTQVLLAGVSGGFSPGTLVFAPPTD